MYFVNTPKFLIRLFPEIIWECPAGRPDLHLTFDDGPSAFTGYILDFLHKNDMKATFFCLGQNIEKHPLLFDRMKTEGHTIGNHGYRHLDGWRTSFDEYIENVTAGYELTDSSYFRPPFGRLTPKQYRYLTHHFQIIMWSLMPGDFDKNVSSSTVKQRIKSASAQDIIVLHDCDSFDVNWWK